MIKLHFGGAIVDFGAVMLHFATVTVDFVAGTPDFESALSIARNAIPHEFDIRG